MQLEFRADGAHISGYVNVTEKKSRPVMTPHGQSGRGDRAAGL